MTFAYREVFLLGFLPLVHKGQKQKPFQTAHSYTFFRHVLIELVIWLDQHLALMTQKWQMVRSVQLLVAHGYIQ